MLSEKERLDAQNEAIKQLEISCGKCHAIMRNMGEWPVTINTEKEQVQAARWVCTNCKYPSFSDKGDKYMIQYAVFIPLK